MIQGFRGLFRRGPEDEIEVVSDELADAVDRHVENAVHAVGGDHSKVV